jgi:CubicO group peptidase (beta-lactamase class C family)
MDRRQFSLTVLAWPIALAHRRGGTAVRSAPSDAGIVPPDASFLNTLPHLLEVAQVPGIGIGVVQDGRLAWEHYAGLADNVTGRRLDATTLFPAASLGKPVFAAAVLRLVDEGRLALDRPLAAYLTTDQPTEAWASRITARHVLSHASGLPNWRQPEESYVCAFEPGTGFRYSGEGYYLLQRVVEAITDRGTAAFMDEQMARLGMPASTYVWRADAAARIAHGHNVNASNPRNGPEYGWWDYHTQLYAVMVGGGQPIAAWRHAEILSASQTLGRTPRTPQFLVPNVASSLLTTVSDYAAFLGQIVSAPTRGAMLTPASPVNRVHAWGLGWGLEHVPDTRQDFAWHWGDNGYWKNFALVHPASRSAIVVFSNGSHGMRVVERVIGAATQEDLAAFLWIG